MNTLKLDAMGLQEMNSNELVNTNGGIAPLILAAWGIMLVCDAICVGMYYGYHQNKK